MRYFLPLFFLLPGFLKKRIITSAIFWYSEFTDTIAERMGAYWEPKYLCTIAREVYRVGAEMAGDVGAGIPLEVLSGLFVDRVEAAADEEVVIHGG